MSRRQAGGRTGLDVHLTIAMLTYRRNEYLAQVIPQLLEQADDVSGPETW